MVGSKGAVIGLQTGDEGKGKLAAWLSRGLVIRYQGGGNAGHTIKIGEKVYKLHQIPSGILTEGTFNLMGEGVFFDPRAGLKEIKTLWEQGISVTPKNFGIASNAHVTLDYHVRDDVKDHKKAEHTSTGRGIKQTAVDKYGRIGLRFQEFLNRKSFLRFLKEVRFPNGMPGEQTAEAFVDSYAEECTELAQYSVLQSDVFAQYAEGYVLGEGAQGFRLDVDRGLYPGSTSSNPTIVPFPTDWIIGVIKLYESSVGHNRPFVSHMDDVALENALREQFGEIGTTTGLPRDLGWVDVVAIRHAVESTHTTHLASSCGDRLEALKEKGEKVKLVVAYEIDGVRYDKWDVSFHDQNVLYRAKPIYEEFESWEKFVGEDGNLTPNAQRYVERIEELVGVPFALHGTGPKIDDVISKIDIIPPLHTIAA